jgi:ribose transport system permease protein
MTQHETPRPPKGEATSPSIERVAGLPGRFGSREFLAWLVSYWTVAALGIILIVFAFVAGSFYTRENWIATSVYATGLLPLALAQSFAIFSGGIDLSVSGTLAFSSIAGAMVMHGMVDKGAADNAAIGTGIAVALSVGLIVGAINGLLITKLKLAPFIVTLGMLGVMHGATNIVNNGQEVSDIPFGFSQFGSRLLFGGWISTLVAICLGLTLVSGVVLARTRFGLRTYALGSNREGSRRAGVGVDWHITRIYAISGFLAACAGLMLTARFGVAQTNAGNGTELDSIAAVVIGGASLFGGTGTIFGTFIGVCLLSVLVTGLILADVQPFWQMVATGLVIIGAVYIDQLRDRLRFSSHGA